MSEAFSREDAEQLIREAITDLSAAMEHGGASVSVGVQDQRFSKFISGLWSLIGVAALGLAGWGIHAIDELNVKVGVLIDQGTRRDHDFERLERRLEILEGARVSTTAR